MGLKLNELLNLIFLGIVLNECLTWNSHIQKIACKIAIVIGIISRLKRFLPCDIHKTIYNALIQPHLNFGILLWGNNIKRILKLQKWAVRAITCSKYNAHTDPIFKTLNLLNIKDIINVAIILLHEKQSAIQCSRATSNIESGCP